jgi:hypothetical protein
MDRNELHIVSLDEKHYADIGTEYFALMEPFYKASLGEAADPAATDPATGDPLGADPAATGDPAAAAADPAATGETPMAEEPLTGPGFVIQLTGYHYHNADQSNQTLKFLRDGFFKNLEEGTVKLPDKYNDQTKEYELVDVPIKDLGVSRVWLVQDKPLRPDFIDPDAQLLAEGTAPKGFAEAMGFAPEGETAEGAAAPAAAGEGLAPVGPKSRIIEVERYDFILQFCWQPKTRTQRRAIAEARAEAEKAAEEAEAAASEEVAVTDGVAQ